MILLDTNVLSEALRPSPFATVVDWLDDHFAVGRSGAAYEALMILTEMAERYSTQAAAS